MTTVSKSITDNTYTMLTTMPDFFVQANIGRVLVTASDTPPADDAEYIILEQGAVLTHTIITGTLWGKMESSTSAAKTISVTE